MLLIHYINSENEPLQVGSTRQSMCCGRCTYLDFFGVPHKHRLHLGEYGVLRAEIHSSDK